MKIYFCDLCNESIPQEDLEKNQVKTVRGKMVCSKCVPAVAPRRLRCPLREGRAAA